MGRPAPADRVRHPRLTDAGLRGADTGGAGSSHPREVAIRGEMIRLGQLLKLAGIAEGGGHAKALISDGDVKVNEEREARRGRQLHPGDLVEVDGDTVRIASEGPLIDRDAR